MLMTVAKFELRPQDRQGLLDLARELVVRSRAESGCLDYGCYQDIANGDLLLTVGYWADHQALAQHYQGAHFRSLVSQFAGLVSEVLPSVSLYDVVEVDRL